ncbi:hypothetical protein [Haloferax volcanii]|uniref:hypothetical protein n=1 Tax=Haloferax volcanii TaxID=2246 RepID=UPI00349FB9FA
MVRVSWETSTGKLVDVRPGDGPGQYSDGADAAKVEERLRETENISEVTIATSVAGIYGGSIDPESALVTTETYSDPSKDGVATTLAFVEYGDHTQKLEATECDSCGFVPESSTDWESRERKGPQYEYLDWICPECETIAHSEAF